MDMHLPANMHADKKHQNVFDVSAFLSILLFLVLLYLLCPSRVTDWSLDMDCSCDVI